MNKPIPFGKYFLLERINMGGMAEVFRAKAYGVEGFERLVAVKRILPSISEDKEFIRMFIDEAKIAVQLSHANIAQVFDLGRVGGSYYIALEHIHGRDLRALYDRCLEEGAPMPVAQACFVTMKMCEGLDYAHNKRSENGEPLGLVHRDISPQNVLVSFEGEVKVIDFGIAKAAGRCSRTQAGILKGKFAYMSPEQVRGQSIDRRSDVFSTGIVLYELLAGRRLFVGESDFSTLEKVRKAEIPPPSSFNESVPEELSRIVMKALARETDERYQNAIDLHDDLQKFVYESGEFYSRKDLAAWMKSRFAKEIAREAEKFEQYRNMRPPEAPRTTFGRHTFDTRPSTSVVAANPTQRTSVERHRRTSATFRSRFGGETRVTRATGWGHSRDSIFQARDSTTASAFDASLAPPMPERLRTRSMSDAKAVGQGSTPVPVVERNLRALTPIPSVEERKPKRPMQRASSAPPVSASPPDTAVGPVARPVSAPPSRLPPVPMRTTDAMPVLPFLVEPGRYDRGRSRGTTHRGRRGPGVIAVCVLLLVAGGGGALAYYMTKNGGLDATALELPFVSPKTTPVPQDPVPARKPVAPAPKRTVKAPSVANADKAVDPNTGFDLVVSPSGAQVRLDGKLLRETPPVSIRNLMPGTHRVEIVAPAGYRDAKREVRVRLGQAQQVRVSLDPRVVRGRFRSSPSGARVTLLVNGVSKRLGRSPREANLSPDQQYQVMFEKSGYATVTQPVVFPRKGDAVVSVTLAKKRDRRRSSDDEDEDAFDDEGFFQLEADRAAKAEDTVLPESVGEGTLMLSSKPPCRIWVDGKDTGTSTPQRALKLSAGVHRITLVNREYGFRDSFRVRISAGKATRQVRDLTDRMPPE